MIDRELLAQVMRSHIANEFIDSDASAAIAQNDDITAMLKEDLELVKQMGCVSIVILGSVLMTGFNLGREYESLAGQKVSEK